MKLSLGPIQYYWPRQKVMDFYAMVAKAPVDLVYLGENVCSKRRELRAADWLDVAHRLADAGKTVILSSLALLEAESERLALERLVGNGHFMVEANDATALGLLVGQNFVAGPHINTYNAATLAELRAMGAIRWVLPVELSSSVLQQMHDARPEGLETEVIVFGKLPLAFSARCFTARAHNVPKDACGLACLDDPGGKYLNTQDSGELLTVNGIQLQSAEPSNLIEVLPDIAAMGVDVVRLLPEPEHMAEVIEAFRDCIDGHLSPQQALERIEDLFPRFSDGYWHGAAGMSWHQQMPV